MNSVIDYQFLYIKKVNFNQLVTQIESKSIFFVMLFIIIYLLTKNFMYIDYNYNFYILYSIFPVSL